MSRQASILAAGGLVPVDDNAGDVATDTVDARCFDHPALDHPVVCLSATPLAPGVDLAMEFLGFESPVVSGPLARQSRRALGFPGWALIHDPDRAGFALEVVKSMKAAGRRARSKPGAARDAFDAIGDQLGRSVPHFLPSYYEEVGRIFIREGSLKYAGTAFNKAREAERVHALEVDEEVRAQAFLDFALAGALSSGALTHYGKELMATLAPDEAWATYRTLALKRTIGGMPPWNGMIKDMRRLAKAAGLAPRQAIVAFLAEVIEAPSLTGSPSGFWADCRKALVPLCAERPEVRQVLAACLPRPSTKPHTFFGSWVSILDEVGVFDALEQPAAWLSKFVPHVQSIWGYFRQDGGWRSGMCMVPGELFAVIRRLAPRMVEQGIPVVLDGRRREVDVDLLDLLLECGVPVAPPSKAALSLKAWVSPLTPHEERGRDPVYVQADPSFAPLLRVAVGGVAGTAAFEEAARGKAGLSSARRDWLLGRVEALTSKGLVDAGEVLQELVRKTTRDTFDEFPEALEALEAATFGACLARTLRGGVIDEVGCPELEEAVSELGDDIEVYGCYPYPVLVSGPRFVVLGGEGRVLEGDIPGGPGVSGALYADGQVAFSRYDRSSGWGFCWTGTPDEVHPGRFSDYRYSSHPTGAVMSDGSVTCGARAVYPGDSAIADMRPLWTDGETYWRQEVTLDGHRRLREYDPRTGESGRLSLPSWLEAYAEGDWEVDVYASKVHLLPPGRQTTLMGGADGRGGVRVRRRDTEAQFELPDGTSGTFEGIAPDAYLKLPGHAVPRVLRGATYRALVALHDPVANLRCAIFNHSNLQYCRGTPLVMPMCFWELYTVRDPVGSLALRALSDADGAGLLEACVGDADAEAVVAERLAEITDPGLRAGVAGVVDVAVGIVRAHVELVGSRQPQDDRFLPVDAGVVLACLGAFRLSDRRGWGANRQRVYDLGAEVRGVGSFLAGGPSPAGGAFAGVGWEPLIGCGGAVAFIAASSCVKEAHREDLLRLVGALADTPFEVPGNRIAVRRSQLPDRVAPPNGKVTVEAVEVGGARFTVRIDQPSRPWMRRQSNPAWAIVTMVGEGSVYLDGEVVVEEEVVEVAGVGPDVLHRLVAEVRARGPRPPQPEAAEAFAAATGLSRAEACMVWEGLPRFISSETNFLPKDLRQSLGLKVAEAVAARDALHERAAPWARLYRAAMPEDPTRLWEPLPRGDDDVDSPVVRLAAAWNGLYGRRIAVPDELLVAAKKAVDAKVSPSDFLPVIAEPDGVDVLTRDGSWTMGSDGPLAEPSDEGGFFDGPTLSALVTYIPWLFGFQPVGDPFRAGIPKALELARARVENPDLLVLGGRMELPWDPETSTWPPGMFFDAVGGEPFTVVEGDDAYEGRDAKSIVGVAGRYRGVVAFRPSLMDWASPPPIRRAVSSHFGHPDYFTRCELLLSDGFTALARRVTGTPVPEGGFEANPALSCPDLVASVGGSTGLGEDAAVLYLQTLALPNPSTKNVRRYNGWTAARYKKAVAACVAAGCLVEAKRSRAGRKHFLPGPWLALKTPHPPIEAWKMSLYDIPLVGGALGKMPLGRIVPLVPLHDLFAAAWARVEAGDVPTYEEV